MVTDCICICLYVFFVYISFADVAGERGGERQTTKASVTGIWLEGGDDSQCPHLFSLGTPGISLLNATSTIHLFNVGWQMGHL